MQINAFLEHAWNDYLLSTPIAKKVKGLLESAGEPIINDHIALRTFKHDRVGIAAMSEYFINQGYKHSGDYAFEEKKLDAIHLEHQTDKSLPKIFISELRLGEFSDNLNAIINEAIDQIPSSWNGLDLYLKDIPWQAQYSLYQKLLEESEYAAWVYAIGYRPNHFTVSINELKKYNDILKLNQFLKEQKVELNDSGGEVKGSKAVFLEQSSTKADKVQWKFADGEYEIRSCYYEFAKRYPLENGELYQGFVAKSADKIFESTND